MKIGSNLPQDGAPPRDATAVGPNDRTQAKDAPRDRLVLSDSVRAWLGSASAGPEMIPTGESSPAYSEADIRSKGPINTAMDPEKLAAIQDRVQSGFYSQDAVRQIIAGRLAEEIIEPTESAE